MADEGHTKQEFKEFFAGVTDAITEPTPKVVLVVGDDPDDSDSVKFQVFFDPPFDNQNPDANPDVFGVAGGFIDYMRVLMGGGDHD